MALPNNPTQSEVVKAIKDLENAPAQATDVQVNGTSIVSNNVANLVTESAYDAVENKIATKNDIPTKTSDLTNDSNFAVTNANNNFSEQQTIATTTNDGSHNVSLVLRNARTQNYVQFAGKTANGSGTDIAFGDIGVNSSGKPIFYDEVNSKSYTLATTADIPTNYVTTDTAQTISGAKTFTTDLTFNANGQTQLIWKTNNTTTGLIRSGISGSDKYMVTQADKHYWGNIANGNRIIFDATGKSLHSETDENISLGTATIKFNHAFLKTVNPTYYSNGAIARPTSANFEHYHDADYVSKGRGHIRFDISSGNMTTAKPAQDGYITTFMWDNDGMYDAQLFIPNSKSGNTGHPQLRWNGGGTSGTANWNDWANMALEKDVTHFATCSTAAATKDKVATISGVKDYVLRVGAVVGVKYTYTNSYSATTSSPITLNVNNTGAKNIYFNNTATPTGTNSTAFGAANRIMYYMYDGSYWVFLGWSGDNNTSNTAGSTNTTDKIFLVGAKSQASAPQTYSNVGVYVDKNPINAAQALYAPSVVTSGLWSSDGVLYLLPSEDTSDVLAVASGANMDGQAKTSLRRVNTSVSDYGGVWYMKYGKLVILNFSDMAVSSNISSTSGDNKLFSGAPKPKQAITFAISYTPSSGSHQNADIPRLEIKTDGCVYLHYSAIWAGEQLCGQCIYIEA